MHRDPFARLHPALVDNGSKRSDEAAAEAGGGGEFHLVGQAHKIGVGMFDGDIFGKRAPAGEARLCLVLADLVIARITLEAAAAADGERHCDALAGLPACDLLARGDDDAGKFMARHVRQRDAFVMTHPAMPVAAAQTGRLDLDDDAIGCRLRIRNGLDPRRFAEFLEDDGFHRQHHLSHGLRETIADSLSGQAKIDSASHTVPVPTLRR